KLTMRPSFTGSPPYKNTIGIVEVARWAKRAGASVPTATISATGRLTSSAAKAATWRGSPRPQRYSMDKFLPSIKPLSASPPRNARRPPAIYPRSRTVARFGLYRPRPLLGLTGSTARERFAPKDFRHRADQKLEGVLRPGFENTRLSRCQ